MIFDSAVNPFGAPFFFYKECTSTQEVARSISPSITPNGTVIAAGYQSAGHGRVKTRRWVSQAGENLLFTLVLRFSEFDRIPECLTLKTGLAVYNAVAELFPALSESLAIKWPNDIMIGGKKTAGIAAECSGETVFLGIGINYAQQDLSGLPNATSIVCELPDLLKEAAVQSSALKNWFEEAAIKQIAEWLLNSKPIATLTGNEFPKSEIDLVTQVERYFNSIGGKIRRQGMGNVQLTRRGIKDSIGHKLSREKAAAFKAVPDIIQKGMVLDHKINWKNRGYDTYVIIAPIGIGDKEYAAEVIINSDKDGTRFYLHEVEIKEKLRGAFVQTGMDTGTPFGASKLIIAKLIDDVKIKISLGINENNNPPAVSLLTKVLSNIKEILGCKNNEWRKAINECLYMKNKSVTFLSGNAGENTRIEGILNGISEKGEILITPNGSKIPIPFVTGEQLY